MAARAFVPLQTAEDRKPVAEQLIVPICDEQHPLYGKIRITAEDCQQFAADFDSLPVAVGGVREMPIELHHKLDNGAMGWLRAVRVDPQRGLIGTMVFNEPGTQAVADEQFPYLSPTLTWPPKRRFKGLSLVARPFFQKHLPKVQLFCAAEDLPAGEEAENLGILVFGDPEELGLTAELPQQAGATPVADNPRNADPSLAPAGGSGGAAQATPGPTATAGQQLAGAADQTFTADDRVMNLEREIAELQRERRVQTFAAELEGMTFGAPDQSLRLAPSLRDDLAAALAEADPEVGQRLAGLIATMPQRFYHPGELGLNDSRATPRALTSDEQLVCEQLRMTPAEFLAGRDQ